MITLLLTGHYTLAAVAAVAGELTVAQLNLAAAYILRRYGA